MVFGLILVGCGTITYHVQTFSDNIEAWPTSRQDNVIIMATSQKTVYYDGNQKKIKNVKNLSIESATIMAHTYDNAMIAAKNAGLTKVISVEYMSETILYLLYLPSVRVRCTKE
jgi:hypothetical protein